MQYGQQAMRKSYRLVQARGFLLYKFTRILVFFINIIRKVMQCIVILSFQPKSHDKRLQKSNKHLSGFLTEVSDELQANIDKMSTCLQKWNGEEWSRGPFLEVTVKMNKQLISIEDVLKEKCSVLT